MKKICIGMMIAALLLTGCSGSSGSSEKYSQYDSVTNSAESNVYGDYAGDESYDSYSTESTGEGLTGEGSTDAEVSSQVKLDREMLVYTCEMQLDVLDFNDAVAEFKNRLAAFDGFVESETYSDDSGYSKYYDEDRETWHEYYATVRIPSNRYDEFCNGVASIGDLRSKTASVENVSQEYRDIRTTLEIYEAKQSRYIEMLASATSDEYAIQIESELTDIQIQIAKLKTRMQQIETDVAYSYVNVTLREVKKYSELPMQTDTFVQRLKKTVAETLEGFGQFLEALLFLMIRLLPYALLILIIVVIIVMIVKRRNKKKKRLPPNLYPNGPYPQQGPQNIPPQGQQNLPPQNESAADENHAEKPDA